MNNSSVIEVLNSVLAGLRRREDGGGVTARGAGFTVSKSTSSVLAVNWEVTLSKTSVGNLTGGGLLSATALKRKCVRCSHCQELDQLADLASDWLFTQV